MADWPKLQPWVVVGVSENPEKYGHKIYADLKNAGYRVYGINPKLETILGDPCYPNLDSLPETPAVVDFVIPPQATLAVIEDCARLGIKRLWFQPGSSSDEAVALAEKLGLTPLVDACILIQRLPQEAV